MIITTITMIINAILGVIQRIYNAIWGNWNYGVLFGWLPADIIAAVNLLVIILFGLAIWRAIKSVVPFL